MFCHLENLVVLNARGWCTDFGCFSKSFWLRERYLFLFFSLNTASSRTDSVTWNIRVGAGLIIQNQQRWRLVRRNGQTFL